MGKLIPGCWPLFPLHPDWLVLHTITINLKEKKPDDSLMLNSWLHEQTQPCSTTIFSNQSACQFGSTNETSSSSSSSLSPYSALFESFAHLFSTRFVTRAVQQFLMVQHLFYDGLKRQLGFEYSNCQSCTKRMILKHFCVACGSWQIPRSVQVCVCMCAQTFIDLHGFTYH
jgi:hypothetical protein